MISSTNKLSTSDVFIKLGCHIISLTIMSLARNCVSLEKSSRRQENSDKPPGQARKLNFYIYMMITVGITTFVTIFNLILFESITSLILRTLCALCITLLIEVLTKIHVYLLIKHFQTDCIFLDIVKAKNVFLPIAFGFMLISYFLS